MAKTVRKAVIAAAGFGTRFLPQTKAMPKEMLPLIDKPIIQYIVEELVEAGIEDIVIVTGYHKRSIEDHFDGMSGDLRANLEQGGKHELLEQTEKISSLANFAYIRQKGPYGNGTPVLNAEPLIGDEPFFYTFADDFFVAEPSRFRQMADLYQRFESSILPCVRVEEDEDFKRYGIVDGEQVADGIINMKTIIEKPGRENAPTNLASISGYLLTPDIFQHLHAAKEVLAEGQEFLVHFGMQRLIDSGKKMYAFEVKNGRYFDTGNKLEYLKTVVDFGLRHPELGDDFRRYLADTVD